MSIGSRIRAMRIQKAMTQGELSDAIGVSKVALSSWENEARTPSTAAIIQLSRTLNVSTDYLLGVSAGREYTPFIHSNSERKLLDDYRTLDSYGKSAVRSICAIEKARVLSIQGYTVSNFGSDMLTHGRMIPLYSTPSAAGVSIPVDDDEYKMILVDDDVPYTADFAVKIQGDSMLPYIHDGEIVYIRRDSNLDIGDVGIFCVDGAMYCKQYYIDDERNLYLLSANEALKDTNVYIGAESGSNVKCYGKVLLGHNIPLPEYFVNKIIDGYKQ